MKRLTDLAKQYHNTYSNEPELLTPAQIKKEIEELKLKQEQMGKYEEVQEQAFESIKQSFGTEQHGIFANFEKTSKREQNKIKSLEETIQVFKRDFKLRLSLDIVAFNYGLKKYIYDLMLKIAFLEYKCDKLRESIGPARPDEINQEEIEMEFRLHENARQIERIFA